MKRKLLVIAAIAVAIIYACDSNKKRKVDDIIDCYTFSYKGKEYNIEMLDCESLDSSRTWQCNTFEGNEQFELVWNIEGNCLKQVYVK